MKSPTKKKVNREKWTFVPNAIVDTTTGAPMILQILDRISTLDIPLKYLRKIANEFGTYVEVKLLSPKNKKQRK